MDDVRRRRHSARLRAHCRAASLVLAMCLLGGCSSATSPDPASESSLAVSASPTAAREHPTGSPSPAAPATDDAATLADQLDAAAATLRDRHAATADVRRAGEFQQVAVRDLATAPAAFRRQVTARLQPETARVVRACVRAAGLLRGMTSPQRKLPHWRIVAPPPPHVLLGYYRAAQRRTGVPWTYLAAIHLVETRMGRLRGTSTAGARGPMQFIPSTWDLYGAGGDINDPADAILAAGRLLKANGAPGDMAEALWHFNPSRSYVRAVTEYARTMQRSPSAYRGFWSWRVLYRHVRGTYVLPVGYPDTRAVLLPGG